MSNKDKRVVCLNCMDGRIQVPVINWIKDNYPVDYVDMVTEAGMDGVLADSNNSIDEISRKIQISIEKNHASMIFVVGHHDCKGNPVDDSVHKEHIRLAVDRIKEEFSQMDVVGLWMNEGWSGERLG